MKKHFSRLQEVLLVAAGSLAVALMVAQLETPYFLKASLLSFGDFYKKGVLLSQNAGDVSQCWKNSGTSDLIFDNHSLQAPWGATDASACSGMQTGDLKHPDGVILKWGQWDTAGISGYSGSSGGGGDPYHPAAPSGGDMYVCYEHETTGERRVVLGRNAPAGGQGWWNVEFSKCNGISPSNSVDWSSSSGSSPSSGGGDGQKVMCTQQYDPVCGEDGMTYGNECSANVKGVKIKYWGECGSQEQQKPDQPKQDDQWKRDGERWIKDMTRALKDRQNELNRNFRNSKADLSAAKSLLSEWESGLAKMQDALKSETGDLFWGMQKDIDEITWSVNETFQKLYSGQRYENFDRQVKDREKELSNMERNLKDATRGQAKGVSFDTTNVQKLLDNYRSQLDSAKQKYGALSSTDPGLEEKITDVEYELNSLGDVSRDFWDMMNEVNQKGQSLQQQKDAQRVIKDKQRNMKDKERAIKDLARRKVDASSLDQLMASLKELLSKMEQMANDPSFDPQAFWDENSNFDNLDRDFWDANNELNEAGRMQEEQKNMGRVLQEKTRTIRDVKRQCYGDNCGGGMGEPVQKMGEIYGEMEKTQAPEDFWDKNATFDEVNRDFQDQRQMQDEARGMQQFLKGVQRELKDRGRFIDQLLRDVKRGDLNKAAAESVTSVYEKMKQVWEQARAAVDAKDFEKARDLLEMDFDDLRMSFEDAQETLNQGREAGFFKKELTRIGYEIDDREKELDKALKRGLIGEQLAETCRGYATKARSIVKEVIALIEQGDLEAAKQQAEEQLQSLGEEADRVCKDVFVQSGPNYDSFNKTYVDEPNQDVAKAVLERVSGDIVNRVLENMSKNSSVFNELLEKAGSQFEDKIVTALEASSFVPDNFQQELLSRKAAILEQIKEMEELTAKLEGLKQLAQSQLQELQAVREQIASYNFVGEAGSEMEEKIQEFIAQADQGTLSRDEIQRKIVALKKEAVQAMQKAKEDKFARGMIPFKDTDDNEWFTKYAAAAKEEGWVKGTGESGYTEVNPGAETNVAEAVTMLGRVAGETDTAAEPASQVGRRLPEWARPGAAALEQAGVDLGSVLGNKKPGDTVTRGEVAQLLKQVFRLESGDASSFADVNKVNAVSREAIGAVKDAGIMTGEGDGSRFNPNGALNRAALMKILTKAEEMVPSEQQ